jgi:hypothetical protein
MQQQLDQNGVVPVRFRCELCPRGCVTIDYMLGKNSAEKIVFHQHQCHHFPSLTTDYKRIGSRCNDAAEIS